jgi:quercetin dioxygenase-like cupin family protein
MNKYCTLRCVLLSLWFCLLPPGLVARQPQIKVEQLLQTTHAWDSSPYTRYPNGQPQVTVLKITIPPHTALPWHRHPIISVAYVLSGRLTIEKKNTGERKTLQVGQAVAETVQTSHRGFTTDEPVELIVFYAGKAGVPLTIKEG